MLARTFSLATLLMTPALSPLPGPPQPAPTQAPVELRLTPTQHSIRPGRQLNLALTITNSSAQPVGVIAPNRQNEGLRPYYLELSSPSGELLEVESRVFCCGRNESALPEVRQLSPSSFLEQELEVNGWGGGWKGNYYSLQRLLLPGVYVIRLRYHPGGACTIDFKEPPELVRHYCADVERRVWDPGDFIVSNDVSVTVE